MKKLAGFLFVALALGACATKNHFGPDVDPVWASQVERICEERTHTNRGFNRCLEEMAEYD